MSFFLKSWREKLRYGFYFLFLMTIINFFLFNWSVNQVIRYVIITIPVMFVVFSCSEYFFPKKRMFKDLDSNWKKKLKSTIYSLILNTVMVLFIFWPDWSPLHVPEKQVITYLIVSTPAFFFYIFVFDSYCAYLLQNKPEHQ